jgi:hypothetical protein
MNVLLPGIASGRPTARFALWLFKNVSKAWPLPVLNPTARVASLLTRMFFKSLTYVSAESYGPRRVIAYKNV